MSAFFLFFIPPWKLWFFVYPCSMKLECCCNHQHTRCSEIGGGGGERGPELNVDVQQLRVEYMSLTSFVDQYRVAKGCFPLQEDGNLTSVSLFSDKPEQNVLNPAKTTMYWEVKQGKHQPLTDSQGEDRIRVPSCSLWTIEIEQALLLEERRLHCAVVPG